MNAECLDALFNQQTELQSELEALRNACEKDFCKTKATRLHDIANQLQVVELKISGGLLIGGFSTL